MSYANGLRMMQGMMSERWPADVEDTLRAHGIPLLQRQARNWVDVGNGQVFPVETVRPWSEVTSLIFAYACCHYLEASGFTLTYAIAFPVQHWLADHIHTQVSVMTNVLFLHNCHILPLHPPVLLHP